MKKFEFKSEVIVLELDCAFESADEIPGFLEKLTAIESVKIVKVIEVGGAGGNPEIFVEVNVEDLEKVAVVYGGDSDGLDEYFEWAFEAGRY